AFRNSRTSSELGRQLAAHQPGEEALMRGAQVEELHDSEIDQLRPVADANVISTTDAEPGGRQTSFLGPLHNAIIFRIGHRDNVPPLIFSEHLRSEVSASGPVWIDLSAHSASKGHL